MYALVSMERGQVFVTISTDRSKLDGMVTERVERVKPMGKVVSADYTDNNVRTVRIVYECPESREEHDYELTMVITPNAGTV